MVKIKGFCVACKREGRERCGERRYWQGIDKHILCDAHWREREAWYLSYSGEAGEYRNG